MIQLVYNWYLIWADTAKPKKEKKEKAPKAKVAVVEEKAESLEEQLRNRFTYIEHTFEWV